jgi:hypothetical protein
MRGDGQIVSAFRNLQSWRCCGGALSPPNRPGGLVRDLAVPRAVRFPRGLPLWATSQLHPQGDQRRVQRDGERDHHLVLERNAPNVNFCASRSTIRPKLSRCGSLCVAARLQ